MPPVAPRRDRRREIIEQLLEHLPDYEPTPARGGAAAGDGDTPRMPAVYWTPSVQELLHTLERLQLTPELDLPERAPVRGSSVHAHLTSYYHCEFRIVRPRPIKRTLRGRVQWVEPPPTSWKRERIVSPWIILTLVRRGVAFVDDNFRGEPYLPQELFHAVA